MQVVATGTLQWVALGLFVTALLHTFSTPLFHRLAKRHPAHAGAWHLLGEVEAVFGFWAMLLMLAMFALGGKQVALGYLDSREFTEPMFVFVVMVIAASRPILALAGQMVHAASAVTPLPRALAFFFCALALVPLLGSLITEPAAMTLAALLLRDRFFAAGLSTRLKYATIGVLFVNISIGGTLTAFAAPPVLMVAAKWGWDSAFMLSMFGWKAALAVVCNALLLTLLFRRELAALEAPASAADSGPESVPWPVTVTSLVFLFAVILFAHHAEMYLGLFIFFLAFVQAYPAYQERLIMREAFLVAFFLAGLVVLGGQQQWWLQPLLLKMSATQIYYGAAVLTAVTDNAALTYLGSLVEGLSAEFKYSLVAGAVTGGGLTIIANAPNPAGFSILKEHLPDNAINPLGLLLAALPPTLVALVAFRFL